jgi:hypothetical protein
MGGITAMAIITGMTYFNKTSWEGEHTMGFAINIGPDMCWTTKAYMMIDKSGIVIFSSVTMDEITINHLFVAPEPRPTALLAGVAMRTPPDLGPKMLLEFLQLWHTSPMSGRRPSVPEILPMPCSAQLCGIGGQLLTVISLTTDIIQGQLQQARNNGQSFSRDRLQSCLQPTDDRKAHSRLVS